MPRRKRAPRREILPDPKYGSLLLAKFVNRLMKKGKKSVAEKIIYSALHYMIKKYKAQLKSKPKVEIEAGGESKAQGASQALLKLSGTIEESAEIRTIVLDLFESILNKVKPSIEVKSRRVGGSTYQVPVPVDIKRGMALAMRWIIQAAKKRAGKTMAHRLADELLDALEGRGGAIKKMEDTHRMANANKAFAHYKW